MSKSGYSRSGLFGTINHYDSHGQACRQGMNAASSPTSIMTMTEKGDGGAEFPAPLFLHRQK